MKMQLKGIFIKNHSFIRIVPLQTVTSIFLVFRSLSLAHIITEYFLHSVKLSNFRTLQK